MEKYPRGRRGGFAKALGGVTRAGVRLPPSPPHEMTIGIRTPRDWTTMVFFLKRAKLRRSQLFASQTQFGHKFEKLKSLNAKSKRGGIRTPIVLYYSGCKSL